MMADQQVSNLVVLTFEGQEAAEALYRQIEQLEKEKLIVLEDAVIVEREANPMPNSVGDDVVRVKETRGKKGKYAAIGGGIGLLAAAILGGPVGLAAAGTAGIGALTAAMKDFGIGDDKVQAIKQRLQPNTSALLLLGRAHDREALLTALRTYDGKVVMTSLDPEVERELIERLQS